MKLELTITKKRRYILISILLAFYISFGMMLDITKTSIRNTITRFAMPSAWNRLYSYLITGLKGQSSWLLMFSIAFIFAAMLYIVMFSHRYRVSEIIINLFLAVLFSFCHWAAIIFAEDESWDKYIRNRYLVLRHFLFISAITFFIFALFQVLTVIVKKYFYDISEPVHRKDGNRKKAGWKVFASCFLIIFILWLPYFFMFYPAILHGDAPNQILQYYHYPVFFQRRWITDGVNTIYSNDHPFVHTLLIGWMMDLGLKLGDVQYGFTIFSGVQMLCFIAAIAALITVLYHFTVNRTILRILVFIYALVPVFPMYAMMIGGDSFLTLFFLLFMILLIILYQTKGESLQSRGFMLLFGLSVFMLGIAKNQGIYIAIVTIIFTFILFRKQWKRLILCTIIPIMIFYGGYQGMLFRVCHVGQVGKQEAFSFFFQQTARYVKYHGDEVTDEERENIDAVIDYSILAEKYDPNLSDPVKRTYRENVTSDDLKNYFRTWFRMGLKHPAEYAQATIANTWQYYSPCRQKGDIYYYKLATIRYYREEQKLTGLIPEDFLNKYDHGLSDSAKARRETIASFLSLSKYIPGLNWFILPGSITWLMILGFLILWIRKNYKMMMAFLPVLLVLGVCLLSPKNGNVRYLLPAYTVVPAMLALALGGRKENMEK